MRSKLIRPRDGASTEFRSSIATAGDQRESGSLFEAHRQLAGRERWLVKRQFDDPLSHGIGEQSPLPVRHTLAKLGIPRPTFYRWYDRHSSGGPEALSDRSPRPDRVWNRISDNGSSYIAADLAKWLGDRRSSTFAVLPIIQ